MGELREKMRCDLLVANYRPGTVSRYVRCASDFAAYYWRSPAEMGRDEVQSFLHYLSVERGFGPARVKMYVAGLKFLYERTLNRPEVVAGLPWPRVPRSLPDVLSGSEVERVLMAIESPKHRGVVMSAYGAGLRLAEASSLRPEDIDSDRMVIHIRHGKRGKDRYVMLGNLLLLFLRRYWSIVRPKGGYLFPGEKPDVPIGPDAVRNALRKAITAAGIKKRVTPHLFRHSFATHMLEAGNDIRIIQAVLGHASIRTTSQYTKVTTRHLRRVKSPLDLLGTKEGEVLG